MAATDGPDVGRTFQSRSQDTGSSKKAAWIPKPKKGESHSDYKNRFYHAQRVHAEETGDQKTSDRINAKLGKKSSSVDSDAVNKKLLGLVSQIAGARGAGAMMRRGAAPQPALQGRPQGMLPQGPPIARPVPPRPPMPQPRPPMPAMQAARPPMALPGARPALPGRSMPTRAAAPKVKASAPKPRTSTPKTANTAGRAKTAAKPVSQKGSRPTGESTKPKTTNRDKMAKTIKSGNMDKVRSLTKKMTKDVAKRKKSGK